MSIKEYGEAMLQDVLALAEATGCSTLEGFTELVAERLSAAGEFDEPRFAYHRKTGLEVTGWALDEETGVLHAFVSIWTPHAESPTLTVNDTTVAIRRLTAFLERCHKGYVSNLEESDPVWEFADLLSRPISGLTAVRLHVFSNHVARRLTVPKQAPQLLGVPVDYQVWDLERLYRLDTSGLEREPIAVDVEQVLGRPLECLEVNTSEARVLLAIMPGQLLADLYGTFGARLLERNVRSFLQARGAVNRGIRDSLIKDPKRFLAYNNGISATAADVSLIELPGGAKAITEMKDLQIVNGGQTTASLYHAAKRDRADLSQVYVQAKITVVGVELVDQIVPLISRYSNTQNKVTGADFSANHPFHVRVEELSRTIWAPAVDGTQKQTRWFYERARGQYADELNRAGTPARQKQFKIATPPSQKFTKTDLAKFMNTWEQRPQMVSLGAEKNFLDFMSRVDDYRQELDPEWFHRLIAKGILYRAATKIVHRCQSGYYAQNVGYTLSKLYHATQQRIDLDEVWRRQRPSDATLQVIEELSEVVQEVILNPVGRLQHVGEWCKKVECWKVVSELDWQVPPGLEAELLELGRPSARGDGLVEERPTQEQEVALGAIADVEAETWFALANWAKTTGNLQGWQRQIAFGIGRRVGQGALATPKQAVQGVKMLEEARRLGFQA